VGLASQRDQLIRLAKPLRLPFALLDLPMEPLYRRVHRLDLLAQHVTPPTISEKRTIHASASSAICLFAHLVICRCRWSMVCLRDAASLPFPPVPGP
jgi:hypothetical protein